MLLLNRSQNNKVIVIAGNDHTQIMLPGKPADKVSGAGTPGIPLFLAPAAYLPGDIIQLNNSNSRHYLQIRCKYTENMGLRRTRGSFTEPAQQQLLIDQ
ncbi:hypothetical protein D3C75_342440 [compost metagenome]